MNRIECIVVFSLPHSFINYICSQMIGTEYGVLFASPPNIFVIAKKPDPVQPKVSYL